VIEFALGAIAASALYTFFPTLAVVPSGWLRKAWAWFQSRKPDDTDQAGA
jgi:hypothetical protein